MPQAPPPFTPAVSDLLPEASPLIPGRTDPVSLTTRTTWVKKIFMLTGKNLATHGVLWERLGYQATARNHCAYSLPVAPSLCRPCTNRVLMKLRPSDVAGTW